MNKKFAIILISAGTPSIAFAADEQLEHAQIAQGRLVSPSLAGPINHVYYNIGTGEAIITSITNGQTVGAETGSSELIWSVDMMRHQCDGLNGHTGNPLAVVDDIDGTDPLSVGSTWSSMGDIASDTVIDCIGFNYWSSHTDSDLDEDGQADGIPGFGLVLDWWDADNGFAENVSTRIPLIQLTFGGLQGGVDLAPGFYAGYIFTVDLTADNLGVDLTMEIGDSDGDLQDAAVGNSDGGNGYPIGELGHDIDGDGNDDADIDGDGLFDWTRGIRFIQPGTTDYDDDGIIDGIVADQGNAAVGLGAPAGHTLVEDDNGEWGWEVDLTHPAVATGVRTFTGLYLPPDPITGEIIHSGLFASFAGFDEDGVPNPPSCDEGAFIPATVLAHDLYRLYDTVIDEPVDVNSDGRLDFFDVSLFLQNFANGDDYNNDGVTDFFDVSQFLIDFGNGIP